MLLMTGVAKAQDNKVQIGPEIEFEELVHDYGNLPYCYGDGWAHCEFKFTNTGNEPLVLQKPKTSCGCTLIDDNKREPVLPGESSVIKVKYNTKKAGQINRTVTVTSNAIKNSTVVLRLKGHVLNQPTEVLPEKKNDMGSPVNNK